MLTRGFAGGMKLREDVRWVIRDNGGFVYFPEDGRIEVLNATAALIIKCLLSGLSIEETVEKMASKYPEIQRNVLQEDVIEFIHMLEMRGLLSERKAS